MGIDEPESSTATIPDDPAPRWLRAERRIRRISMTFMILVVVAAAFGLLGVWTGTASATEGGYTLEVEHARVSRGGLATPFSITVIAEEGSLPEAVTLRLDSAYLAMFDENGLDPEPVSTFSDGQHLMWTFDVPAGSQRLTVDFDARIEPSAQWGKSATLAVVDDDQVLVSVDYTTVVVP